MKKFEQSKRLVASGLALTFGTFIMSGIDSNSSAATKGVANTEIQSTEHAESKLEVCSQLYKTRWESNTQFTKQFPLSLSNFAKALGVTVQTLETGKFGSINCNPGFSPNEIGGNNIIVDVKNVSDECLVWGYEPKKMPPGSNTIYDNLVAICVTTPKPTIIKS